MRWRLGVDLGPTSLGTAALELDSDGNPTRIVWAGSRIFADGRDPKSGDPLAAERREARALRRGRDRFKQRQAALLKHLVLDGLFPADPAERQALAKLDPYALRARALHEILPQHHVGRALFHLNQRRGFKSNRKTDGAVQDDDTGKIRTGINRLHEAMADAGTATFGEFLHARRASATHANEIPPVRSRLRPEPGEDARGNGYDFYPDRALLEEEFEAIWSAQAPAHPDVLTAAAHDRLFEIIFHQRPLKKPRVGTCVLVDGEERLPAAHPLFQRRRLLEELNALRIVRPGQAAEALTLDQRNTLLAILQDRRSATFASLRKKLKLDPAARFNKEDEARPQMKGDEIAAELGDKSRFGPRWARLDIDTQWAVITRLIEEEDEPALLAYLQDMHGLTAEQAAATAAARLPRGHGRFGKTATTRLIEAFLAEVIVYSTALQCTGLRPHDGSGADMVHDELPYYGTVLAPHITAGSGDPDDPEELGVGRLGNPTVHIGLNQLRRVVNGLIKRYGRPHEIAIELARDLKLDDERKREFNRRGRINREAAEHRSRALVDIGEADKGGNRLLLKLWEELNPADVLDRRCVYTGARISLPMLFSGAVEVDHILPFSATLDDSDANRLLCLREARRDKGERSPHEAFGPQEGVKRYDWEAIAARAGRLPREKRWRFEPDAMSRFHEERDFLSLHLNDTQYLSRLVREYLSALYPQGEGERHVWVSPGRLTGMLRRGWGLNALLPDHNVGGGADRAKNRLDHRHHPIDAIVTAVADRPLLERIAQASAERGIHGLEGVATVLPAPWDGFRDDVKAAVNTIVVSHRVDHGSRTGAGGNATAGRLHNDTAYGLTEETDAKGNPLVVHRIPLTGLKKTEDIERVRDADLRAALHEWTQGLDGRAFETAVQRFSRSGPPQFRGIRHLRVIEPLSVIPIRDAEGRPYKGYKGDSNYRYDVWEMPDGKWEAEVVTMFEAHQPDWSSAIRKSCPTARKILKLHQNDLLAIEPEGSDRRLVRVVKFGQNGQITLAEPQEGGDLKRRDAEPGDPFKYYSPKAGGLKRARARQVRIDELGRVYDPGFPARKATRKTRA